LRFEPNGEMVITRYRLAELLDELTGWPDTPAAEQSCQPGTAVPPE
jgi:hypothetical protein